MGLVQMKESLETWSTGSSGYMTDELQKVLPVGAAGVNSVKMGPDFARSIVMTGPTEVNILTLPNNLEPTVQRTFNLTAAKGSAITLPSGEVVAKAFRGISTKQSELISSQIRIGITEGESIPKIAKRLRGRLQFGRNQEMSAKAQRLAAGDGMKLANNQVMTIVRTSVNQVQNAASQATYAANQDVTQKYEYVATLDARTSTICGSLDGQRFNYNEGPLPPQHFNCRSTTVPIIDDEDLRRKFPDTRPSATGRVPQNTNYATWLKDNPSIQDKALGN